MVQPNRLKCGQIDRGLIPLQTLLCADWNEIDTSATYGQRQGVLLLPHIYYTTRLFSLFSLFSILSVLWPIRGLYVNQKRFTSRPGFKYYFMLTLTILYILIISLDYKKMVFLTEQKRQIIIIWILNKISIIFIFLFII